MAVRRVSATVGAVYDRPRRLAFGIAGGHRPPLQWAKCVLGGIFLAAFFPLALFAQTATLRGTVTDDSGAIVPGAKITLTASSGTASTSVAGADGAYSFTGIAPGDYVAQASAPDL